MFCWLLLLLPRGCFWSNVAEMAPNGVALSTHHRQLPLPSHTVEGWEAAWECLTTVGAYSLCLQLHRICLLYVRGTLAGLRKG